MHIDFLLLLADWPEVLRVSCASGCQVCACAVFEIAVTCFFPGCMLQKLAPCSLNSIFPRDRWFTGEEVDSDEEYSDLDESDFEVASENESAEDTGVEMAMF